MGRARGIAFPAARRGAFTKNPSHWPHKILFRQIRTIWMLVGYLCGWQNNERIIVNKIIATICTAALVATTFASMPVSAASMQLLQLKSNTAQVITVQNRDRGRDDHRGYERRGRDHYYNGQRGYSDRRPGYRQYNGFWFPPAAFAFGAIIGGVLGNQNNQVRPVQINRQHLAWCESHYRSYRASDNSFKPSRGSRQSCVSPFMR